MTSKLCNNPKKMDVITTISPLHKISISFSSGQFSIDAKFQALAQTHISWLMLRRYGQHFISTQQAQISLGFLITHALSPAK